MPASSRTAKRSANSRSTKRRKARSPRRIVYLTDKDLAYVVHRVAEERFTEESYGEPMPPFELLPGGKELLDSAIATPRWDYHETVHEKGAALFRSIVKNHALRDGNKRLGITALDVFLRINRVDMHVSQDNLVQLALAVASYPGNFPLEPLTKWIRAACTGRPRRIVHFLAQEWPHFRAYATVSTRTRDRQRGLPPRIPGRRVRFSKEFWDAVAANEGKAAEADH